MEQPEQTPTQKGGEESLGFEESIFVGIPSYRDPECKHTIKDLYEKAKNPKRVVVGVCNQLDFEEDAHSFLSFPQYNVREKKIHWTDARGPCLARHIVQSLWQGEEYYLQIDSHMRFVKDWDEKLIKMLHQCDSKKPILTTYPIGYELPNKVPLDPRPTALVVDSFGSEGMLRFKGKQLVRAFKKPIKSYFWVSGFAFSRSEVIREVPYDPHLPFLFFGEETQMNLRLWTHGWDFYSPGENIVFHLWSRKHRTTFREVELEGKKEMELDSLNRVKYLLGMSGDEVDEKCLVEIDKYGLGKERRIEDYKAFCGVDLVNGVIEERATYGGLDRNLFSSTYMIDTLLSMVSQLNSGQNDSNEVK